MDTLEFLISIEDLDKIKNFFKKYIITSKDKFHESIYFLASYKDKFLTTVYKNGLVIITGKDKEKIFDRLKEYQKRNYELIATTSFGENNYFGPIVAASCFITEKDKDFIDSLDLNFNLNNLKKLFKIAKLITENIKYDLIIFKEKDINTRVEKNWSKNKILSFLHNTINVKMGSLFTSNNLIIMEEFSSKNQYLSYLKKESFSFSNIFLVKDSVELIKILKICKIIASYYYYLIIIKTNKDLNINIPFNNNDYEENLVNIYKQLNQKLYIMQNITKTYFKEVNNILDNLKNN